MKEYNFKITFDSLAAREICNDLGLPITIHCLIEAGRRFHFSRKLDGHWEFDKEGLEGYVKERLKKVPKNWACLDDVVSTRNIPQSRIRAMIKKESIPTDLFYVGNLRKTFVCLKTLDTLLKAQRKTNE